MNKPIPDPRKGSLSPELSPQEILEATNEPARYPLDFEAYEHLGFEDIAFERYTSKEFFDAEMDKVWTKVWQYACRDENIPEVGDHIVYDIGIYSILVVRSAPGEVKAFYNSCMHRGTKLRPSWSSGSQEFIACPYHGWSWNVDGTLRNIPSKWDFTHVNDEDYSLAPVRAETWGGFVFINMDFDAPPLLDYLGPLPDHFKNWDMGNRYTTVHAQKELPCNWKSAMEAFMENYHTWVVHPQLNASSSGPSTQYDLLGDHLSRFYCMLGVPDPALGRTLSEQEKVDMFLMGDASLAEEGPKVEDGGAARATMANFLRKQFDEKLDVDIDGLTDGEILDTIEYTLFPNMFLFPSLSMPMVYRFRPLGTDPDKSIFDILFLRPIPRSGEAPESAEPVRFGVDESYATVPGFDPGMAHVYDQDTENLGLQQEGFHTAAKKGGTMANYQEIRIRHLHQTIDKYIDR